MSLAFLQTRAFFFGLIDNRGIKVGWLDPPLALRDFSRRNKQKIRFQLALNKTFCLTPPPLSYRQLQHLNKKKLILSTYPSSVFQTELKLSELTSK